MTQYSRVAVALILQLLSQKQALADGYLRGGADVDHSSGGSVEEDFRATIDINDQTFLDPFEFGYDHLPRKLQSNGLNEYDRDPSFDDEGDTVDIVGDDNGWSAAVAAYDQNPQKLIVGGQNMAKGERGFCLALDRVGSSHYRGLCAGTLIADQWILTAGHCMSNNYKNDIRDKFDTCYMNAFTPWTKKNVDGVMKNNGGEDFQAIPIEYCVEHPSHNPGPSSSYDFAVCKLQYKAHGSLTRTPIASNSFIDEMNNGQYLRTIGFGYTSFGGSKSDHIKEVYVPYVPNNVCSQALKQHGKVDNTMICAGGEGGKDACGGDSGGPLYAGPTLVGVTSWGYKCAVKGMPGVYARTGAVLDWIQSFNMEGLQIMNGGGIVTGGTVTEDTESGDTESGGTGSGGTATGGTESGGSDAQETGNGCKDSTGDISIYDPKKNKTKDHSCEKVADKGLCDYKIRRTSFVKAKILCQKSCKQC